MTLDAVQLAEKCRLIEFILLDVDGVLTDGVIAVDDNGVETKHFHVRDGSAIALWKRLGKRVGILSGRRAKAVDVRAAELGISPVIQGVPDKLAPFKFLIREWGIDPHCIAYMGDDLADLPVLGSVGLAACPRDAAAEVCDRVHLVTEARGGFGAVRELMEVILRHQGLWQGEVDRLCGLARVPD